MLDEKIPIANPKPAPGVHNTRYKNPTIKPAWYKARQRTITRAQKRVERELWPKFGLEYAYNARLDLDGAFGRTAPTILEIGCGNGEAIVALAAAQPECNFVGVDWFRSGLAVCLGSLEERGLTNVRLIRSDAANLLERGLPDDTPMFDEVKVFFPDPWYGSPERRVIRPDVVQQLSRRMRHSSVLHVATDVACYPEHVRQVFASPQAAGGQWEPIEVDDHQRPSTRYEREGIAAGRPVEDLHFAFRGRLL